MTARPATAPRAARAQPCRDRTMKIPFGTIVRLALLAIAVIAAPAARAQDARPDAAPAVLTAIRLLAQSPYEARFALDLAPRANGFAPLADAPENKGKAAIALALTTRASTAGLTARLDGLVRQVRFEQVDSVLIVHFSTTTAAG